MLVSTVVPTLSDVSEPYRVIKFIESHQCSVLNFCFVFWCIPYKVILRRACRASSDTKLRNKKVPEYKTSLKDNQRLNKKKNHWHLEHFPHFSPRCVFSLHTRLGRSQRRQCETLQDPQARQRGILHHHAGTVWHLTEACQTLHRYAGCDASRSLLARSLFIAVFHHTWKLLSVAPGRSVPQRVLPGEMNRL